MRDLRDRIDAGILLITHDMGVVADLSDRVLVMQRGRIVESGTSTQVFHAPQDPYTQELLRAVPHLGAIVSTRAGRADGDRRHDAPTAPSDDAGELVVDLRDVAIEYPKRGRAPAFRAVDGVTLTVEPGEVVGLVGESGSGKTTIGRAHRRAAAVRRGHGVGARHRHGRHRQGGPAQGPPRRQLRVPGPRLVAQPAAAGRRVDRRAAAAAEDRQGRGAEQARRGPARPGPPRPRPAQPLPARAVRRPASAGRHRPGAGARTRGC